MNMTEAKRIYKSYKGHFFDKNTMKFFGSRIESGLFKDYFFVTSELDFFGEKRAYTIRKFSENYSNIENVSEFQKFGTKDEAMEFMKKVSENY